MNDLFQNVSVIAIDGNIGSGKSTFISYLKTYFEARPNVVFLAEPVNEWNEIKDNAGTTMLEHFYNNPRDHSFAFQILTSLTRYNQLCTMIRQTKSAVSPTTPLVVLSERSLMTDMHVFEHMLYNQRQLSDMEHQIYTKWANSVREWSPVLRGIVYIRASVPTCLHRIRLRNRTCESNIAEEYLAQCHEFHEKMMDRFEGDVLKLDGDVDIKYEAVSEYKKWAEAVSCYIQNKTS